jgi:anti-sigma B factor antagonist
MPPDFLQSAGTPGSSDSLETLGSCGKETRPPYKPYTNGLIATITGVSMMSATTRIQVNDSEGIKVVRFQDHQLFDERTVREVADQIAEALPNDGSPIRLVVDFSEVSLISSTFLSKLILLQRRIDATRGKLRLCEMTPIIQQVFRTSNLDRLFKIDRDQRTAIESFH